VYRLLWIIALVGVCGLAQSASVAAKTKAPMPCKVKGSKTYPGDDAPKAQIAKWMAESAIKAGLPPELPVMAALVESNLTNLALADADSVGFFQMRVSIWNQGSYAGFPDDPGLQLRWFVDQALLVAAIRIAEGESDLYTNDLRYGEWVADVQRPSAEFRGRYQLRLEDARTLICA
jgi:hypothetical protein